MTDRKRHQSLNPKAAAGGNLVGKESAMKRLAITFALTALALSACAPKPESVAEQLIEAVNSQDIEGALELFAENAIVNTGGPVPYTGTVEIRGWLEELADTNFEIKAEVVEVNGNVVVEKEQLTMDPWTAIGLSSLEGVSEITVADGLVETLQFTFTEAALNELQTAMLRATEPSHSNVSYVDGGSAEQVLDIYLPVEGSAPYPTILMIHGSGDEKEHHNGMAGFFNQAGFAAVLIDYGNNPNMISDAICSLAWTHANAGDYGLDPDRITVFGFSVGGLLASTIGSLDDSSALLQDCGYEIPSAGAALGIAIYEGVLGTPEGCLSASWCLVGASADTGIPLLELQPIFETLRDTSPEMWSEADVVGSEAEVFARQFPLYWLDGSEPPYLLVHGSGEMIPRIGSEAFAERLEGAGVNVELLLLPNAGHQSVYPTAASFPDIAGAIVEFASQLGSN